MQNDHGEIIICQAEDGQSSLDVHLQEETVWLTQKQISSLFGTERSVITKHVNNVFRTGELERDSVCTKFAHTAADGKTYQTNYYNLDVIIAVGYRVNAKRGTQFRIWATNVLTQHLIKGYTVNERRLAEKGLSEMEQAIALLARTLERHESLRDEGKAILALKDDLLARGEVTELFGQERGDSLLGILGNLDQTFGGPGLIDCRERPEAEAFNDSIDNQPACRWHKMIRDHIGRRSLSFSTAPEAGRCG